MLLCAFYLHRKQSTTLERADHHHLVWVGIWDLFSRLQNREKRKLSFDDCRQLFGKTNGAKEHIPKVGYVNRQDVREAGSVEGPFVPPRHCWDKSVSADRHVNTANLPDVALLHQIPGIPSAGPHAA